MNAIKGRQSKRLYFSPLDLKGIHAGKTGGGLERMARQHGEDTSTSFKPLKRSFPSLCPSTGLLLARRHNQTEFPDSSPVWSPGYGLS